MQIDKKLYNEINEYCKINGIKTRDFIHKKLQEAFLIEKYGDKPFFSFEEKPIETNVVVERVYTTEALNNAINDFTNSKSVQLSGSPYSLQQIPIPVVEYTPELDILNSKQEMEENQKEEVTNKLDTVIKVAEKTFGYNLSTVTPDNNMDATITMPEEWFKPKEKKDVKPIVKRKRKLS